jgi:predicted dehydrogenase
METSQPFRLALIGAGLITQESHLPAALASPAVEVTAIVDPVVKRAAALAHAYGVSPRIAARVDDVLVEIDGAVIATPNDTHQAIAVRCLEAGVPVLIEKPLASAYQEGVAILAAAEANRRVVAVGYATRFRDEIQLLKDLLDERHFGAVRRFVHQFGTRGGWAPLSAYNLSRKAAGGGALVVTGTHFLDRMLHFWGYPDEALLEDDSRGGPEANCTARFRYSASGVPFGGVARYSKTARLPSGMVVETDRGYVILSDSDDAQIVFRSHAKPEIEVTVHRRGRPAPSPRPSVFQLQLEDFIDACRRYRPPRVDGRQGLESLRLLEQLYASRIGVDGDWYAAVGSRGDT